VRWTLRQGQTKIDCYLTSSPNGAIIVEILQLQMILRRVKADTHQDAQKIMKDALSARLPRILIA
jgi:hypothetical protein